MSTIRTTEQAVLETRPPVCDRHPPAVALVLVESPLFAGRHGTTAVDGPRGRLAFCGHCYDLTALLLDASGWATCGRPCHCDDPPNTEAGRPPSAVRQAGHAMTAYETEPCKTCDRPMIWTVTERDKRMPVDAQPSDTGTVALSTQNGVVRSRVLPVKLRFGRKDLRTSHFATCPDAAKHRRRGGRRG